MIWIAVWAVAVVAFAGVIRTSADPNTVPMRPAWLGGGVPQIVNMGGGR